MCCVWGARYITGTEKEKYVGLIQSRVYGECNANSNRGFFSPSKTVIAMCGDGGLSMLLGDNSNYFSV
jgi:pyruvate dehydrogenase (quinone)